MRSLDIHKSIILLAVLAAAALFSWIAASDIGYLLASRDRSPNAIHVVEATYGENCLNLGSPSERSGVLRIGNGTAYASQVCNNTDVFCPVYIDRVKFGKPAAVCEKDFNISWRCGKDSQIRRLHIAGEAIQQLAWLSCSEHEP